MDLTVVVTAVAAERDAVADGIGEPQAVTVGPYADCRRCETDGPDVLVVAAGVGPAAAAAAAAYVAGTHPVGRLLSVGIAGAFPAAGLSTGDVVVADQIVAADLGADSPERFLDLTALGFGDAAYECDPKLVALAQARLRDARLPVLTGSVLTLSTATGTARRAQELMARHRAVAEAMEGAGVAHVARLLDVPVLEVRAVSNAVGDRDPASWDLLGALDTLTRAAGALLREALA